jgi:hypothetical protein
MNDKKRADELELIVKAFLRDQQKFMEIATEALRLAHHMHGYRRSLAALQEKK